MSNARHDVHQLDRRACVASPRSTDPERRHEIRSTGRGGTPMVHPGLWVQSLKPVSNDRRGPAANGHILSTLMLTVEFDGFKAARSALNGGRVLAVRPIDIARAAAITHDGVDLPALRRLARLAAVANELLAHLEIAPTPSGHFRMRVLGLGGLDQSARAELSHRVGVGLARVVAENALGLVDLYSLDSMSREHAAPRIVSVDGRRRQPDFVGSDAIGNWALLEAKGRGAKGTMTGTRNKARVQVRAVALEDTLGRPIPVAHRLTSVGRLNAEEIVVYFEDPEDDVPTRTYRFDPDSMVYDYYTVIRGLRRAPWLSLPGVIGARGFVGLGLPGGLVLAVHRAVLESLDEPHSIREARAAVREDLERVRREAVELEDGTVSIGLDGLGLGAPWQFEAPGIDSMPA